MAVQYPSVHVWLDTESEGRDDAKWIVSFEDGLASDTVSIHESKADAFSAGRDLARKRGLPLYHCRDIQRSDEPVLVED